jgi:predicted GIY-YIG superfamily endonuclease
MSRVALYRHFDADGALLYVGVTNNPQRRMAEHRCRAAWRDEIHSVKVKWFCDRLSAEIAEREAITSERPVFNGGRGRDYEPTGDAFRDWLAATGTTQDSLAAEYGLAKSTVSQMASGTRRTPLRFAAYVEDISEGAVPIRYWLFGATAALQAPDVAHVPDRRERTS